VLATIDFSYVYAAVATETNGKWKRVATFDCWCKYETGDLLNDFVSVESAPDGENELVIRTSGGARGYMRKMKSVFDEKRRTADGLDVCASETNCPSFPAGDEKCHLEYRTFSLASAEGLGVLVETRSTVIPRKYRSLFSASVTYNLGTVHCFRATRFGGMRRSPLCRCSASFRRSMQAAKGE